MNEVIEKKKSSVVDSITTNKEQDWEVLATTSQVLPLNKLAVQELQNQRELLAVFVRSQLKEASFSDSRSAGYGEGDFGIIPGTKKRCLFKPGAEKLLRLFGLGVRFRQTDKELDRNSNFALYTYRAEVYTLKNNHVIAECEATANSQEVKYKERTEWKKNANGVSESKKVETPIYDVINTLQKMAQKRAMIGAVLLATGASEYFTQDFIDSDIDETPQPKQNTQTEATYSQVVQDKEAPTCCGKQMMISKYLDKDTNSYPFYCLNCKSKKTN